MPQSAPNLQEETAGTVTVERTTWDVVFVQDTQYLAEVDVSETKILLAKGVDVDQRHDGFAWACAWVGCNHEATRNELDDAPPVLRKT